LLKLKSGYNIGIRESEIIDASIVKRADPLIKDSVQLSQNSDLRNVAMVITGGTISSRLDPKSGGVVSTDAEEILKIAPEIKDVCNIVKIVKPFMKWSEDMSFKDWKRIAEVCEKLLNDDSIDGVIITHGTDFIHYTSAALSFFLKDLNKPVAITYSQKSIDRASTDSHLNLLCAARFASSDIAEVSLIGHEDENDSFCLTMPGTRVRKLHTSKRDAFKIVNSVPFAKISNDSFDILREFNARDDSKKVKLDLSFCGYVVVIKIFPGQDPKIIDHYISEGCKGLILEVTGIGQVPGINSKHNWWPKIKKAINAGIIVCAVPQTIFGTLNPNVYSAGRELQKTKIVFLKDMLSETAFVKLGWVLGHKHWDPKKKMLENFSGEISN